MNLLPDIYKKELKLEAWRRFLIFVGSYFVLIGITGIIGLLPSYFILKFQIQSFLDQLSTITASPKYQQISDRTGAIETANQLLNDVGNFGRTNPKLSLLLDDFALRTPPEIVFTSFAYAKKPDGSLVVAIGGTATRSDIFLSFLDNLKKSPFITAVDSPLSNIFDEINPSFTITADINSAEMKK